MLVVLHTKGVFVCVSGRLAHPKNGDPETYFCICSHLVPTFIFKLINYNLLVPNLLFNTCINISRNRMWESVVEEVFRFLTQSTPSWVKVLHLKCYSTIIKNMCLIKMIDYVGKWPHVSVYALYHIFRLFSQMDSHAACRGWAGAHLNGLVSVV